MAQNNERNQKFGAYKSLCCGEEIVIPEGILFPDCPNHPNLTTVWKAIERKIVKLQEDSERDLRRVPCFRVGDRVIIVGIDPRKGSPGVVIHVLESRRDFVHRYDVGFPDGKSARFFGFELISSRNV